MNVSREDAKRCVGAGWSSLIDAIYDRLPEDAYIMQIKEKFGGLRFYVTRVSEEVQDFIGEMEHKSFEICEFCGSPGVPRDTGWILTLCDTHYAEQESKRLGNCLQNNDRGSDSLPAL